MNILSYTTVNSFPCKESLNITPGKSCLTNKTIRKLNTLENELNKDNKDLKPIIIDPELLPTDGSESSHMIRRLASLLDCSSEYCILNNKTVQNKLGKETVEEEKNRFKVFGPRFKNIGTDGEKHAYRTLLDWSEVFEFFYPLRHMFICKNEQKIIKSDEIMEIVDKYYPDIRVIAADITIELEIEGNCAWHAVVLLIDLREGKNEEWTVEFFDSTGFPPDERLSYLMEDLLMDLKKFKKRKKYNGSVSSVVVSGRLRHQLTSAECGMHALIYIRRRLEGISYKMFSKYKIPDKFAKEFRRDIFIN